MSNWPQISVLVWLACAIAGGLGSTLRTPRRTIYLPPKRQRIVAAAFCASAVVEGTLLWLGGFFQGII